MPSKKKWYKRWYIALPLILVALAIITFITAVIYQVIYPPCSRPLIYTLGSVDKQFGLTNEKILKELVEAESVWENFRGSNLFEYSENAKKADITIDFVYDQRQQDLITNESLNDDIKKYNKDLAIYEDSAAKHDERLSQYEAKASQYEIALEKYNKDIEEWDTSSRTDNVELKRLNIEQERLDNLFEYLDRESTSIDQSAKKLNDIRDALDKRYEENEKIYGNMKAPTDGPIENGIWDPETEKIVIYRYAGDRELKWLLAHEFGHALGMDHVGYPRSLMYHLTSTAPILTLSNDDVRELSRICTEY